LTVSATETSCHTAIVESSDDVASLEPHGLKRTQLTVLLCIESSDRNVTASPPVACVSAPGAGATRHILTSPSAPPVASRARPPSSAQTVWKSSDSTGSVQCQDTCKVSTRIAQKKREGGREKEKKKKKKKTKKTKKNKKSTKKRTTKKKKKKTKKKKIHTYNMGSDPPPSRAKLRWKMLRAALTGRGTSTVDTSVSVRRHMNLSLLPVVVQAADEGVAAGSHHCLPPPAADDNNNTTAAAAAAAAAGSHAAAPAAPLPASYLLHTYTVLGRSLPVWQRPAGALRGSGRELAAELRVSRDSGVDNTGNVGVWPAEEVLAALIAAHPHAFAQRAARTLARWHRFAARNGAGDADLWGDGACDDNGAEHEQASAGASTSSGDRGRAEEDPASAGGGASQDAASPVPLRVIELGAGVGIAGMAMAVAASCAGVPAEVVLTDGNPMVVDTARINVARARAAWTAAGDPGAAGACRPEQVPGVAVRAEPLLWTADSDCGGGGCAERYDLVLASDCFFFRDYHTELAHTLRRLCAPRGAVVAVAPQRGGSLDTFVALARSDFDVRIEREYDPAVTAACRALAGTAGGAFDEDIHLPLLVILTPKNQEGA
jgi:hypothetical protein